MDFKGIKYNTRQDVRLVKPLSFINLQIKNIEIWGIGNNTNSF